MSYGGRLGYQAERKDPNYKDAGDTANTEVSVYDYGDKCIVFETRGLGVNDSQDHELNKLFRSSKGNKIGVVFYGIRGLFGADQLHTLHGLRQRDEHHQGVQGGGNHFANFLDAVESRNADALNADAWEGHLSAGISHLGNISYYLGEESKASVSEISTALKGIKSLDDDQATIDRTVQHLTGNSVDLAKYPMSLGKLLKFDPKAETFTNSEDANEMLTREYRDGFVCPLAKDV